MTHNPGDTLGPYRVVGKLGEGGMGEVYRARDTKLNRDVAIKVLPEVFALDRERLARFEREAPDGQRFVALVSTTDGVPHPATVVLNWRQSLDRK